MLIRKYLCPRCSDFSILLSSNTCIFKNNTLVLSLFLSMIFVLVTMYVTLPCSQRTRTRTARKQNSVSHTQIGPKICMLVFCPFNSSPRSQLNFWVVTEKAASYNNIVPVLPRIIQLTQLFTFSILRNLFM